MIRWIRSWPVRTKAVVLSVLIAGLGQVYLGRFGRALVWFLGVIAVSVVLDQGEAGSSPRMAFGLLIGALSAIDAAIIAPSGSSRGGTGSNGRQ